MRSSRMRFSWVSSSEAAMWPRSTSAAWNASIVAWIGGRGMQGNLRSGSVTVNDRGAVSMGAGTVTEARRPYSLKVFLRRRASGRGSYAALSAMTSSSETTSGEESTRPAI